MRQILRLTILLAGLLMTGCQSATEQKPPSNEAPMVQINSPASNARVPIGREVEINSTASDQSFIKRVELYVNGDLIREDAPPIKEGQIIFTVLQRWVPIEPGEVEVRVIAYDTEEKASYPVAMILQVEGHQLAENAPTQGILIATEGAQVPNATLMPIPTQTAIPIPTQTAIPIPTQTPIPIPSDTPIPIPSDTPIPIPSDTPIPIPTDTPIPIPTETPIPIPSDTPIPIPSETPIPIPSDTPIPIPSDTPIPIPTDTPIPIPSDTPIPIPTDTPIPIPTDTPIPIPSDTPIPIPSDTPIPIPTDTPIPIPTDTPIPIPTDTPLPPPTPAPRIEGRVVAVQPINIRSAPGTNNIPLGILRPNDVVTAIARNGRGDWIKIVYGQANTEGWVFTSLVAWQTNVQTLPIH